MLYWVFIVLIPFWCEASKERERERGGVKFINSKYIRLHLMMNMETVRFFILLSITYISFWFNILKIIDNSIRILRNVLHKVSDCQFTRLTIVTFTTFDLLKVCILFTDTASLIFLQSKTSKPFWSHDQLSSLFKK